MTLPIQEQKQKTTTNYLSYLCEEIRKMVNGYERTIFMLPPNIPLEADKETREMLLEIREKIDNFYLGGIAEELEILIKLPWVISSPNQMQYRLELLPHYCFYFHSNQIFNYLLNENQFPEEWLQIQYSLTKTYIMNPKHFHQSAKQEIYVCHTLMLIIQEMVKWSFTNDEKYSQDFALINEQEIRLKLQMTLDQRIERLTQTLCALITATTLISKNTILKAHCYMFLFSFQNSYLMRPYIESVAPKYLAEVDYFANAILPLVSSKLENVDNQLLYFFAKSSTLSNELHQLYEKIINELNRGKSKEILTNLPYPKSTTTVNIHKDNALLIHLKERIQAAEILNGIEFINALPNKKDFCFNKIFQTSELMSSLSHLYQQCLDFCDIIIQIYLEKNSDSKSLTYHHFLDFRLNILLAHLKLDHRLKENQSIIAVILSKIDFTKKELQEFENRKESSHSQFLQFIEKKISPSTKTSFSKKKLKRQQVRAAFFKAKNIIPLESDATLADSLIESSNDAYNYFLEGNYHHALKLYQEKSITLNPTSIERILNEISMGDVYKELYLEEKNIVEKKEFLSKTITYYLHAKKLAKDYLNNHNENRQQAELSLDIATTLADNLTLVYNSLESESTPKTQKETSTKPEQEAQLNKISATIQKGKLLLPDAFNKFYELLSANGYMVFVVGGYIRDHFLKEKAYDIDVVVYDPKFKGDNNQFYIDMLHLVRSTFSYSEIRSQKHPVLYIQEADIIIEVSMLRSMSTLLKSEITPKKLLQILFEDAKHRDLTDNAIYYNIANHEFIDFFGGINHIRQNELHLIEKPESSFKEDSTRIFRVLRAIVRRSIKCPTLCYDPQIIKVMNDYADKLKSLNKDRCYADMCKLLFRGYALPLWHFLAKVHLQHIFFLLPIEHEISLKHSVMVSRTFANIDERINTETNFSISFVFAVLHWGKFQEEFENITKNNDPTIAAQKLAKNILNHKQLLYKLPNKIKKDVEIIWLIYLYTQKKVSLDNVYFTFYHFQLADLFKETISTTMRLASDQKVNTSIVSNKLIFFKDYNIDNGTREIIRENKLKYSKEENGFFIFLDSKQTPLTPYNSMTLFKDLKHHLQCLLGKRPIRYTITEQGILLTTDCVLKRWSILRLMEFLFAPVTAESVMHLVK